MVTSLRRGFTLIEMVVFIVVSSVALVGVLAMFQAATVSSSDGIADSQAREAAYALLDEVTSMPFTFCDTSDPALTTATSVAACAQPQGLAPIAGKARGSLSSPFTNVGDYGGYFSSTVQDINGTAFPGLNGYTQSIRLSNASVGGVAASEGILVEVTVTSPAGRSVKVSGYRMRHSPNAAP